ncbi:MAG: FtsX-like permease family protein [Hydrogenophaga sp.]|uniref:ABC transporter permease n=1 Tax=Hydrogenophaga sp. TaxID=1904254 RepID=UPI00271E823D|nr:FtsX-like permease family protein [Hydrogenophaga sp.]MDO9031461.1 FtsX-like permease family protein [Hydrogenophaga sp.]
MAINSAVSSVPAWRWALKQTWRDMRSGSLRLLLVAVVLAVTALSAVGFFADRIEQGLVRDAAQLLAADALVAADQPMPVALASEAQKLGLRQANTAAFPSMARAPDERGGDSKLVSLKAVSETYPLRGQITLGRLLADGTVVPAGKAPVGGPPAGQAWVDASLLPVLNLRVGDQLWLGDASFLIASVIAIEPDRGAGFMSFSPRVMIRQSDLAATQLVQPASRVTYRLLVAGPARAGDAGVVSPDGKKPATANATGKAVQSFVAAAELQSKTTRGLRVETLDQGRPEMRATLDRAGLFLRLVALLAALLSAVAVALVSRDFAQRRLDDCAMLRVLGVPQNQMALTYGLQFLIVGLVASLIGLALGWGFHQVFVALLSEWVPVALPAPSIWPVVLGLGVGVVLTLGFGLPPVLQLARVPPLRVLRRDVGELKGASMLAVGVGGLALLALLMMVARDIKLGAIALGGVAVAVLAFAALSALAVYILQRLLNKLSGVAPPWLVLATRQLTAQPGQTVVQVCALAIGLLALVLLVLLRTDLIASWRAATPVDAPNRFVINIQPNEADAFKAQLQKAGVKQFDWYPMIRGRLVAINGKTVKPEDYTDDRAQRLADREFNLSYSAQQPAYNPVVAGRYQPNEKGALSVEEGLAKTLGLHLNDQLTFDIGGVQHSARITSLRKVDWGSMRVNFFVMAPMAAMPDWPATFITAFRAPPDGQLDRILVQAFPSVTVVDVSATLAQINRIMDQVIAAVEFLFAFTLAAGLIVLMAGLLTSRERRAKDWAVLKALGASQRMLAKVQRVELLGVGALAGALASTAALCVGWALARWVFEFDWSAPLWWPLMGAAVGAVLAALAGWWSLRGVLEQPVVNTLRRAAQ